MNKIAIQTYYVYYHFHRNYFLNKLNDQNNLPQVVLDLPQVVLDLPQVVLDLLQVVLDLSF